MTQPATFNLIFNAVGALMALIVVGYIGYSAMHTDAEPPCSARYPAPTRFSLQSSKRTLMSPSELQGRVGLREWGVIENASVAAEPEAAGGAALEVKLAAITDGPPGAARATNGVDFRWNPAGVGQASAACLSYKVWLPEGFTFGSGGALPGIYGGQSAAAAAEPGDQLRFGSRLQWRLDGAGELAVATAGSGYQPVGNRNFPMSRGYWMTIEQELVLNTPGETNGLARLWFDGELKAEDKALALRKDPTAKLIGVLADVGYFQQPGSKSALRLSPFELAWR